MSTVYFFFPQAQGDLMKRQWGNIPDWAYEVSQSLMSSLKIIDSGTYEHCLRVGQLSRCLARDAGLNEYEQKLAEFAGVFHDIGKIGVGATIINKPSRLSENEYEVMKNHPILSEQIIAPLATHPFFNQLLQPIRGHHERIDGKGYPDQLHDEKIPLLARVILIVDTFDAMSQTRAYRQGLPVERVYAELKQFAGTQFDAQLVKIFLQAQPHWTAEDLLPHIAENLPVKKIA